VGVRLSGGVWLLGAPFLVAVALIAACGEDGPQPLERPRPLSDLSIDPTCRFIEDELIVKFRDGEPDSDARAKMDSFEAFRIEEGLDLGGAWLLRVAADKREGLKAELEASPGVEFARLNEIIFGSEERPSFLCDVLTAVPDEG
jgi:hypothetical protein